MFASDEAGAALEFALVAPVLFALILATLQLVLVFLAQSALETACEGSARYVLTGQAQTNFQGVYNAQGALVTTPQQQFNTYICSQIQGFLGCGYLFGDVSSGPSYSTVNLAEPTWTYDINGNVTNTFSYNPGTQGAIVVVRLYYFWPVISVLGFNITSTVDVNKNSAMYDVLIATSGVKDGGVLMRLNPKRANSRTRRLANAMRRLALLARDRNGTAMIEMAFIAPVLLLMYTGSYVVSDMVTCGRKVSLTAHTITDLTSQYGSVSPTNLTAVLSNSAYVLAPYSTANATLRISEVQVTDASHAAVVWSQAQNGTALVAGTIVNLPTNMAPPLMIPNPSGSPPTVGGYFIMGEISYPYVPAFGQGWLPSPVLYNRYFMLPRLSNSIPLTSS